MLCSCGVSLHFLIFRKLLCSDLLVFVSLDDQSQVLKTRLHHATTCPLCLCSTMLGLEAAYAALERLRPFGCRTISGQRDSIILHMYGDRMKQNRRTQLRDIGRRTFNSLLTEAIVPRSQSSTAQPRKCCRACSFTRPQAQPPTSTCVWPATASWLNHTTGRRRSYSILPS